MKVNFFLFCSFDPDKTKIYVATDSTPGQADGYIARYDIATLSLEETIYSSGETIRDISVLDGNVWFVDNKGLQVIRPTDTNPVSVTIQHDAECILHYSIHIQAGKALIPYSIRR